MSLLSPAFDILLGFGLLVLAWRTVASSELFTSVVLFMIFGFIMAIAWARLGAPDLALAEAAISAGLTGALLLNACKAALVDVGDSREAAAEPPPLPRWVAISVCTALGAGLAATMVWLAGERPDVPTAIHDAVAGHVLDNPVTAILLDLRGYDTLLEMVVLLAAFLGVRTLLEHQDLPILHPPRESTPPMVEPLIAMATPVLLMTATYLFWTGMEAPGGAFQAGALLGALGVMYRLTGRLRPSEQTSLLLRLVLVLGLVVFGVFASLSLFWSEWPLAYPHTGNKASAVLIEFSLMISIALTLTMLFSATPGIAVVPGKARQP